MQWLDLVDGSWAAHAPHQELCAALTQRDVRIDLVWMDAPFSEKTQSGHDDGAVSANRARDWAARQLADLTSKRAREARYALTGVERRQLVYPPWRPRDVRECVRLWAPLVDGWFVTITDEHLAPHWRHALTRAGLYVFASIPYVAPGSRARFLGDGPPLWGCWMVFARVRSRAMARWATSEERDKHGRLALPGAYVAPDEADQEFIDGEPVCDVGMCESCDTRRIAAHGPHMISAPREAYVLPPGEGTSGKRMAVVGGKPDWLHEQIVLGYSNPGGLVVDPCGGGGGAGRAALKLGRRAILGDSLRAHAELCAAALREGKAERERIEREAAAAVAYMPPPVRDEQAVLPFEVT